MCQSLGSMTCIEEHYLEVLTIDQSVLLERVRHHWEYLGVDVDRLTRCTTMTPCLNFHSRGSDSRA